MKLKILFMLFFGFGVFSTPIHAANNLVAFQGGGFRAMTAHSAFMAATLKYRRQSSPGAGFYDVLNGADVLSGNSGGTWFLSCLSYSPDFVSSLEDYENFFKPKGYMGLVGNSYINYLTSKKAKNSAVHNALLTQLINQLPKTDEMTEMLTHLVSAPTLNWQDMLSNTVFAPFGVADQLKAINLYDSIAHRTQSVASQPLVFQVAVSTNDAGIGRYNNLNETTASISNVGTNKFTPASITSLANDASGIYAPSLPTQGTDSALKVQYSSTRVPPGSKATPSNVELPNISFRGFSVFGATATSSAAAGLLDSGGALSSHPIVKKAPALLVNNLINLFQEAAIPANVKQDGSTTVLQEYQGSIGNSTPALLANNPYLRLVDGGYVDNTSVTSGLTYLQNKNHLQDGYKVTLLASDTRPAVTSDSTQLLKLHPNFKFLPTDVRGLFVGGNTQQIRSGFDLKHPSQSIFEYVSGIDAPIWEYSGLNGKKPFHIRYYSLKVRTASNNTYGLSPGIEGTFEVWSVQNAVNTAPLPVASTLGWGQYPLYFNKIMTSLEVKKRGQSGVELFMKSISN